MNSFLKNSILVIFCISMSWTARSQCTPTVGSTGTGACTWAIYATFNGTNYQWYRNGTAIAGATTSSYNVTLGGSYTLRATVASCGIPGTSSPLVISDPPIASITPAGSTLICPGGGGVTLNAQTGTGYSYRWIYNNSTLQGVTGSSCVAAHSGTYKVEVTNTSCIKMSNTITVSLLTVSIGSSGTTSGCGGPPVTLYTTSSSTDYQWYLNGNAIAGATSSTFNPSQSGSYHLSAVTCGSRSSSNSISITVTGNPSVYSQGNPNVCQPGGTLPIVVATPDNTFNYQWRRNNIPIDGATSTTYIATQSGDYSVTAIKGPFVCTSNSQSVNFFTINTTVTASGPLVLCPGGNLVLSAVPGYSLYNWYKDNVFVSGNSSVNTYTATSPGSYTVQIVHQGCPITSSPVVIAVGAPIAKIVPSGPPIFCAGGSVSLLAYSEDGYSIQWLKDNVNIPGATGTQYDASVQGSYRISVTNLAGCNKVSDPVDVTITTKPVATITPAGPVAFCQGGSVVLNGSTGTNYTFQWKTDERGDIAGATSASYTATQSGTYKLITKIGSCSTESAGQSVIVNPLPVVNIIPSGATAFCQGETITLLAQGEVDSYQWKRGNSNISGATTKSYVVNEANAFKVAVTRGSCSVESNVITTTVKPIPPPVTAITGPATLPAGDKLVYTVTGNATNDLYLWNTPAGTNITYGDSKRASATIGFNQLGERIISVTAQKNGCESTPVEKIIQVIEAISSIPSQIPADLKVTPDRQLSLPLISNPLRLNTFNQNDIKQVFETCATGEYYAAFQLYYDALADLNTVPNWTALVDITFMQGPSTILWTRSMQINMASQTFISTIFHDTPITCAQDFRFKIKTKSTNINGVQAPEQHIYLKVLLYKRMTDTFVPADALSLNYLLNNGKVETSWTYAGKAVKGYDVEWVLIEDHENFTPSGPVPTAVQAFQFKEPVRVTMGAADFLHKHHAFYPKGRMWFRARAVGFNPLYPQHIIPGQWFYGPGTPLTITNPQANKNWQLQTVFAEEGKYKKVVTYYDGTFRPRQAQTNLSTEDQTLVGETFYDFEGRRSVDILSAPSVDPALTFKSAFNIFQSTDQAVTSNTSAIQKKFHYDNRQLVNSVLSQTSGAGKYYSDSNTIGLPSQGPKEYVPDADGYGYSQTEYMNDGTDRVTRQSGVGEMFRMEGGHNTRYYYAEAARAELVRLFGPNVGNASHYKKNVVVDPNGQVNVSYIDLSGKVIATALAGTPPANVDPLPSYQALPSAKVSVDLSSKNVKANNTSQTVHKFLNEAINTEYTFNYDLSATGVNIPVFSCQSCTYDLTLTITDPDGKLLQLGTLPGNESGNTTSYQRKNLTTPVNCTTPSSLSSVQINLTLADIGDYTITKTLTARELTFDQVKTILQQNTVVQQAIQAIANSYVIDPADCAICTSCTEADAAISEAVNEIADLDCENILQEIIQKLKRANSSPDFEPSEDAIRADALYCRYELCMKDKASDIFEKQLARADRWSVAVANNYQNIANVDITSDPFFSVEELSGYKHRGDMQSKINSVGIKGTPYGGSLSQVTDPGNTSYYINGNGVSDPSGYHILYYGLMSRRAQLGEAAYQDELDRQRWTLFRNLYLEAKRQVKLIIPAYTTECLEARKPLDITENIPQGTTDLVATANQVAQWGKDYDGINKGVKVPVSDEELEMHIASLSLNCNVTFSPDHITSITSSLRAYFDSNQENFLRLILQTEVGVNSNLIAVQTVLNNYSCSLGSAAEQNPVSCLRTITPVFSFTGPNLISNPAFTGCPVNTNITAACSGWKPAYGTPYLMSDKSFQLEATSCAQDALMGWFTTPLVPGKKYRLKFKYKKSLGSISGDSFVQLSRTQEFGVRPAVQVLGQESSREAIVAPTMVVPCPTYPGVINPDLVNLVPGPGSSSILWQHANAPESFIDVEVIFSPTQASTYIFFYHSARSLATVTMDAIFRDVEVTEVNNINLPAICLEYNPLISWAYNVDVNDQVNRCNQLAQEEKGYLIEFATNKYLEEQATLFSKTYRNCLNSATEQLRYGYTPKEYHYTLYYYDQANNLVQTVPPEGVKPLSDTDANSATPSYPSHKLLTRYQHTSINRVIWQTTPDDGITEFLYDKKGQMRLSRNAQQAIDNKYTYTKYDRHGRVIEVGELTAAVSPTAISQYIDDPRFPTTGVAELPTYPTADVTQTYYDKTNESIIPKLLQQNLRSRVSWVEAADKNNPNKSVTYYSYDIHGNVKSLLLKIPGLEVKRIDYVYDLVSGNVNYVFYQFGKTDQFIHKYTYDADNRIKTVSTSSDAYLWFKEASYKYYAHGPLARTEVGEYRVQGQDYYYTLQGWVKGANMPFDGDPGTDGVGSSKVGKDVYAYTLGYYQNDYKASNASVILSDTRDQQWARYNTLMGNTGLYNGNISWMITDLAKIGEVNGSRVKGVQAMLYRYDQLHRLRKSQSLATYTQGSGFATRTATPAAYDENYSYDANGNVLTLQRYNGNTTATLMDDFSYQYYANNNRLASVRPITRDTVYTGAITMSNAKIYRNITVRNSAYVPTGSQVKLEATGNIFMEENFRTEGTADLFAHVVGGDDGIFNYDAIGNLIQDRDQGVNISWTPYGKVREVKTKNDTEIISFLYDAAGNRVSKNVVKPGSTTTTHYVRDASGNVMGVYTNTVLTEQPVYGTERLGQYKGGVTEASLMLGKRNYELSNHLGNVLAVITDNISFQGTIVSAKVINSSDYYPYGMEMNLRTYTDATAYRYGFNGKEEDNEWIENVYNFGARIYNARIARFLSTDPEEGNYPGQTPYNYACNNPIYLIDLNGEGPRPAPPLVEAAIKALNIYIYDALKAANNTSTAHANEWARGRASWDGDGKMLGAIGEGAWRAKIAEAPGASFANYYAHGTTFYGPIVSKLTQVDIVEVVPVANIRVDNIRAGKYKMLPSYDAFGNPTAAKKLETTNKTFSAYLLNYEVKTLNPESDVYSLYYELRKGVNQAIKNGAMVREKDHVIGVLVTDVETWKKVASHPTLGLRLKKDWERLNKAGGVLRLTNNLYKEAVHAKDVLKATILATPER